MGIPRAVTRPNQAMLLDDEWLFELDTDDRGLTENWQADHTYTDIAQWPGSVESHLALAKGAVHTGWHDTVVVWYERTFSLPPMVGSAPGKSLFQLTFGACGYETRVWLNGTALKTIEGEMIHYGEYTSFSYELEETDLRAKNRLTVRIADSMDAEIPRGKQELHVYKRGGIWYQTYTGAVRSVWLELVGRNRLRSRVGVVSIVDNNLVRINLTTRIHDPGQYTIRLRVFGPNDPTTLVAESDFSLWLDAGQKQQRLVIEVPNAKLWSPAEPPLYHLVGQLRDETGQGPRVETHFGLRKVEARGSRVYLNN